MSGEIILYTTDDGDTQVSLREIDGTVWLTQFQLAELFQTSVPNINQHIKAITEEGEQPEATIKPYLIVQNEGTRTVERQVTHYSLPMILAIGFRVRSVRGTQFRRWATAALGEYLVKGFVMDDARLKEPGGDSYFDELLARIPSGCVDSVVHRAKNHYFSVRSECGAASGPKPTSRLPRR